MKWLNIHILYMNKDLLIKKAYQVKDFALDQLEKLGQYLKKTFLKPSEAMKTFYVLFAVAFACFIYTFVTQQCTIPLGGDYSIQEMTFLFNGYDDWHTYFKTGNFPTWDRSTFLGIDNVGGNSFYYLFDPFVLIMLPFPRDWLLPIQGLEFILKMVMAGMFFYWYLGDIKVFSPKVRRVGALAFAFSGYSFTYLWFHFLSSVAFLPLIFLGLERIIQRKDPRIFFVGFFLTAMTSYFFFVVYMFGAFFYAVFRFLQTIKERNFDENWAVLGLGIFSFVVAVLLGAFTLLPGMTTATSMPRVTNTSYLQSILDAEGLQAKLDAMFSFTTNTLHNQVTPLLNFLFMADDCYSSNLLNVYWYDNMAAGLYATTPMLLLFFVSFIDAIRRKKWSYLLGMAFVLFLVFTPVGFYLFSGFTVGYARYFILPISWMIVFDCQALEHRREIPRTDLDISFAITAGLQIAATLLMVYEVKLQPTHFNANTYWDIRMVLIVGCLAWLAICYFVMRPFFHKKPFTKVMLILCSIDIITMANVTIYNHGLSKISQVSSIGEETKIVELLKENENNEDYYRIYNPTADRNNINISFREGYAGLGAFHSVYAFDAQDFLDRSRIPYSYHNWSMGVHNRRYNMETFIGTKYYIVGRIKKEDLNTLSTPKAYPYRKENGYTVYASDYDIPYGYVDILDLNEEQREKLGVSYTQKTLDYLASDNCTKSVYVNTNFIDTFFPFDQMINATWLATNLTSKDEDDAPYYNAYEDQNEYPLLRAAMLDDEDYQKFFKDKKYQTGSFTMNDKTVLYNQTTLASQSSSFRSSMLTSGKYVKGVSAPIELYQYTRSGVDNKLKLTVYRAQWPDTKEAPTGAYAACSVDDPNDKSCLDEYYKEHKWEYVNGIRPADEVKVYEPINGDSFSESVLYNSKILIEAYNSAGEKTLICPDANPNDPSTGAYISIFENNNIEWRFFDQNDVLISFARHSFSEYKQAHGYYVDRPVSKILGIVKAGNKTTPVRIKSPMLFVQRNSDYQQAIDNLKKEPVEITKRSETKIEFTTHFTTDKFVVTNYPKAAGWKVKEVKQKLTDEKEETVYEDVDIYKAQGGFVGFEGKKGEHSYIMEYESPRLKLGCMATLLGLFISFLCFIFFGRRNKKEHLYEDTVSLHFVNEKEKIKEQYEYDNFLR